MILMEGSYAMAFEKATVLTGGIATGKSSVANLFLKDGFSVIDADKVAHRMLELHQDKVIELFGSEYLLDQKIDRKKLGALIFSNRDERKRLESLLHPLIYKEIERESRALDRLNLPYLIDIPLFFENEGRYPIKDIIVVYTSPEIQLERLIHRDGSTLEEAQQRIDAQVSIEEKRLKATYLIDNTKALKHLQDEYVKVRKKILAKATPRE